MVLSEDVRACVRESRVDSRVRSYEFILLVSLHIKGSKSLVLTILDFGEYIFIFQEKEGLKINAMSL